MDIADANKKHHSTINRQNFHQGMPHKGNDSLLNLANANPIGRLQADYFQRKRTSTVWLVNQQERSRTHNRKAKNKVNNDERRTDYSRELKD